MEWIEVSDQFLMLLIACSLLFLLYSGLRFWFHTFSMHAPVEIAEESSMGTKETQEDAAGAAERSWGTLAVLADGIGKGRAGKMAAQVTVDTCVNLFTEQDISSHVQYFFTRAFNLSNKKILEYLRGNKGGAVAAAVLVHKGILYYAAVGDIKIAIFRRRELINVNDGQTMQTAAAKGFARGHLDVIQAMEVQQKKQYSNYLGRDGFKNVEMGIEGIKLIRGDILLVMNHGLYTCLSCLEIEKSLNAGGTNETIAKRIINRFNQKNDQHKENASLFVLKYTGR